MSLDEVAECQQCGTEMYVGAHFCVRCGSRLAEHAAPSQPRQEPVLELTDFDSWLPSVKSPPPPSVKSPPPPSVAAPASVKSPPPPSVTSASPVLEIEAPLSLEEVDRGFDFVVEKTALSACLPVLVLPKPVAVTVAVAHRESEYSRDEVVRRIQTKQSLRRAGLAGVDLSGLDLEGVDLTRADLDGAKLDGAKLRGACLQNASLREASLDGADLSEANLERADLSGAKLVLAVLAAANLRCVNLARADLSGANLYAARLSGADLSSGTLVRAKLASAELDRADLAHADLAMADLSEADLEDASLVLANLSGANLRGANFVDADLTRTNASAADFSNASLVRAKLTAANLQNASLINADASQADLRDADLSGARLERARSLPAPLAPEKFDPTTRSNETRYFGEGDLLRGARLNFEAGCKIHIDGRFEECVIVLGEGAEIVIGESGVLKNCRISGHGDIKVHGCFFERQSPGISGPRSLIVSAKGAVAAALEQLAEPTAFAFEPGCRLRIKISHADHQLAAE